MTYIQYHLIFNLPVLVILTILNAGHPVSMGEVQAAGLVLAAVFMFTIPWDNIAAKWGIWGFPKGKFWFQIGYLPVEEYTFFLLQTLNVILAERLLFAWAPEWRHQLEIEVLTVQFYLLGFSVPIWLAFAGCLYLIRKNFGPKFNYSNHLAWFLPVIYAQWVLAPALFIYVKMLLILTLAGGIYYSLSDIIAIRQGTWFIDSGQSTGFRIAKILPWEEAAFFFLTSLLVAQSYLLLLPSEFR